MLSAGDPRPKCNIKLLTERYNKDSRYFRIHDIFNPSVKGKVLTRKFYSPHEMVDLSLAEPKIVQKILLCEEGIPRDKYPVPLSGNQCYGWYASDIFVPIRKGDRRYFAPAVGTISKIPQNSKKRK